jgi:hypothetical protein
MSVMMISHTEDYLSHDSRQAIVDVCSYGKNIVDNYDYEFSLTAMLSLLSVCCGQ